MAEPDWSWFEPSPRRPGDPASADAADLARAVARLAATPDGARLLAHLRRLAFGRAVGPEAPEATLRHLEGQRALVLSLESLAARGRDA